MLLATFLKNNNLNLLISKKQLQILPIRIRMLMLANYMAINETVKNCNW
jgi:hypothetical protein